MRQELDCALNGEALTALDPRIYAQEISEQVKTSMETLNRPRHGKRLAGEMGREELSVTVRFMIKERDRRARRRIIDRVNGWAAAGGWLTVSTRPEQRLHVVCSQSAGAGAFQWSGDAELVFTALDDAYWQERFPAEAAIIGASGCAQIIPRGNRACNLEAEIRNTSGAALQGVILSANGRTISFTGMSFGNGKTLKVFYDAYGLLHAEIDGNGVLCYRTPASADDLPLQPGIANTVEFIAAGACSVKLTARGRWE